MSLFDTNPQSLAGLFGDLNTKAQPFAQNNQLALLNAGTALMGGGGWQGAAQGFSQGALADQNNRRLNMRDQLLQTQAQREQTLFDQGQADRKASQAQSTATQRWIAENIPELAGLPTSDALKIYGDMRKEGSKGPLSTVGKIQSDFDSGFIGDDAYKAAMEKAAAKNGFRLETGPDGSLTFVQGDMSNLGRKATSDLETGAISDIQNLSDLHSIAELYSEEALTYQGQAKGFANRQLDKLGMASPEGKDYLAQKTKFTNAVEQVFNQYRKEITGAAASVQELDRLKKSLLNTDMSPAEFKAAYAQFVEKLQRSLQIKMALKEQGINQNDPRFGAVFDAEFMKGLGAPAGAGGQNTGVKDWTEVFGGTTAAPGASQPFGNGGGGF